MPEPRMRAADKDREAVVRRLGEHMAAGRLTVAEYEERSARAVAAKTYGDLAVLTSDLPSTEPTRPAAPVASQRPGHAGPCGAGAWSGHPWGWGSSTRAAWSSWSATAVIVLTVWLITSLASGALLYFWPMWVIGPWGAVLLAQSLTRGAWDRPRSRHPERLTR
ncbi:DUF1707 SHOCT-like domain-containing protein [Geodermatophilus sp. SYSU D00815]